MAFTTTAVVLVGLLFAAALGVATAQHRLVERLQAGASAVKHWGGYVLVLVGIWFIVLGVFVDTVRNLFPV